MLEAGVKFDADYMSIQDGQTITARNELHIIIDCVNLLRHHQYVTCHPTASVAPEIVTTNNTTLGKW